MSDSERLLFGVFIMALFLFGMFVGGTLEDSISVLERDVIKHGCAEYDSKTKEFKWIVGKDE